IDFLSSAESGVPSQNLFDLAVKLEFADSTAFQTTTLTELSATSLSALQGVASRAGLANAQFIQQRVSPGALTQAISASPGQTSAGTALRAPPIAEASGNRSFDDREFALAATRAIERQGAVSYFTGDDSVLRFVSAVSLHFDDSDTREGTVGFEQDGWSASLAVEYENASGRLVFGAAATLGESDAEIEGALGEANAQSTGFGAYSSYTAGPVRLAAGLSFADLDLETSRRVLGASALGETDANLTSIHASATGFIVQDEGLSIGLKAAFDLQDLEIDAFAEAGAGDFSLSIPQLENDSSVLTLGAESEIGLELGDWQGAFFLEAGYQLALSGDEFTALPVAFQADAGTSFSNPLRPLANDGLRLRSALSLMSEGMLGLRLVYDGLFAQNGQTQNSVSAQVSIAF
ncbi:MAG: autotransporter outer membrane beta-barrel domain-containing protein, partial [Pseudomonadota bacterium]